MTRNKNITEIELALFKVQKKLTLADDGVGGFADALANGSVEFIDLIVGQRFLGGAEDKFVRHALSAFFDSFASEDVEQFDFL